MSKNKKTILINGALGRMGSAVATLCKNNKDFIVKNAVDSPKHKLMGESLYTQEDLKQFSLFDVKISKLPRKLEVDLVVDFSTPTSSIVMARKALSARVPFVTGTTGFSSKQILELKSISRKIPVLQSYNMSLGINVLIKILRDNIEYFKRNDLEITEIHHNKKVDSPSGTALLLAENLCEAIGISSKKSLKYRGKSSSLERKKGEIGISVLRGGDIAGEHKVSSFGDKENIYITHQALDRDIFARGALDLGRKLLKKKKGFFSALDLI